MTTEMQIDEDLMVQQLQRDAEKYGLSVELEEDWGNVMMFKEEDTDPTDNYYMISILTDDEHNDPYIFLGDFREVSAWFEGMEPYTKLILQLNRDVNKKAA